MKDVLSNGVAVLPLLRTAGEDIQGAQEPKRKEDKEPLPVPWFQLQKRQH